MSNITVKLKNGQVREFQHEGRAGGSYTKRLSLESGFAVIEDEYGRRTIIPSEDIEEIFETPERTWY